MSHTGAIRKHKPIDDYTCDGNGPRPPVPGEESRLSKMTESGGCADRSPNMAIASSTTATSDLSWERMNAWKKGLEHMLCDTTAVELLRKFVETEAGPNDINVHYLNFYFLCEGLPEHTDEKKIRKILAKCLEKFGRVIPDINRVADMVDKKVPVDLKVFTELQQRVVEKMSTGIYPAFFQSNTYIEFYERFQQGELASAPVYPRELIRNASLATVHEDTELSDKQAPKLTEKMLMLTERARFNVGVGAHGYNIHFHTSYNPVTRQNSDKMSCSSGHTKSDQQSLKKLKDGQPLAHRKQPSCNSLDRLRQEYEINMMPLSDADRYMHQLPGTTSGKEPRRSQGPIKNYALDTNALMQKLNQLKETKETEDMLRHKLETISKNQEKSMGSTQHVHNHKHSLDDPKFIEKLSALQDSDQDILDQHVSRVFSPQFSPMAPPSPGQPLPRRQLPLPPTEYNSRLTQSMKHSKSMPVEQKTSRRNSNIYGSHNFDSGISVTSYDAVAKDRFDEEEIRRSQRHSSHSHTRSLPRITEQQAPSTVAVYTYYDDKLEKEVYRTKIAATIPTLKNYKDLMPKKGNQFRRFFFKTVHESGINPIFDELFNDTDVLPLFEAKIMGVVTTNALPGPNELDNDYTIVMYTYVNEMAYRTKIPGRNVTLRQFKDYLPKAGNFRFFFKTICDDIDGPIHEEINNDLDILPLYEGFIMGKMDPE